MIRDFYKDYCNCNYCLENCDKPFCLSSGCEDYLNEKERNQKLHKLLMKDNELFD